MNFTKVQNNRLGLQIMKKISTDINRYQQSKEISKESIKKFIEKAEVNIEVLNKCIENTQKTKRYIMCKDGEFVIREYPYQDLLPP